MRVHKEVKLPTSAYIVKARYSNTSERVTASEYSILRLQLEIISFLSDALCIKGIPACYPRNCSTECCLAPPIEIVRLSLLIGEVARLERDWLWFIYMVDGFVGA